MSILDLRLWKPFQCALDEEHPVQMKVKALRGPDGAKFRAAMYHAFSNAASGAQPEQPKDEEPKDEEPKDEEAPPPTQAEMLAIMKEREQGTTRWYDALPAGFLEMAFVKWVKDVELAGEVVTDEPITTGAQLLEIATDGLILEVLAALTRFSSLTALEGKASSSPSTSGTEEASNNGDSGACPVPSTVPDSGGGTTATATPN